MIEFQMDGTIITANDNFLHAVGYTLDEIKGRRHSMFVDDATKPAGVSRVLDSARSRRVQCGPLKTPLLGKGGKVVWLQATYNPILDDRGRPVKVVKFAVDVTQAVIEELKMQGKQRRFKQMVENATIRIIMADRDFKIVYMNPASVRALAPPGAFAACRVDDILGKSIDIFHKQPEMQRRLLSDPKNLPHRANIRLGDEILDLNVSAIRDAPRRIHGPDGRHGKSSPSKSGPRNEKRRCWPTRWRPGRNLSRR